MFTSMTARVSTNTYCLARTRCFSRRSENSVGRVTHRREAPTDTVQLVHAVWAVAMWAVASASCRSARYRQTYMWTDGNGRSRVFAYYSIRYHEIDGEPYRTVPFLLCDPD